MATVYCRSTDGSDADDGSTWALAKATLVAAVTAAGAGGTVYVSKSHSETGIVATVTIDALQTDFTTPLRIICVDDTGDPEPPTAVSTGAALSMGNAAAIDYQFLNSMYVYGMDFSTGAFAQNQKFYFGADNANVETLQVFENCILNNQATGSAAVLAIGTGSNSSWLKKVVWKNCTVTLKNVSSLVPITLYNSFLEWIGGSIGAWSNANVVNGMNGSRPNRVFIRGVDMSVLGTGQYLLNMPYAQDFEVDAANCIIGASAGLVESFGVTTANNKIKIHNVSNSDVDIQFLEQNSFGSFQEETGIYRTAGASDGTTPYSAKVISTSVAEEFYFPFRVKLADLWADTSTAKTFTVEIAQDGTTTALQDDEVWIEVEYPDDITTQSFIEDDRAADILTSPVNQTTSTEAWTGLSGTNVKQKLEVTTTNTGKAGPCTVWLNVAKPSTTVYACPKVEVV